MNYIYLDPIPDSANAMARAHGRLDVLYVLCKILLVLTNAFANPLSCLLIGLICTVALTSAYLMYQPYFAQHVNRMRIAFFTFALYSNIIAFISWGVSPMIASLSEANSVVAYWLARLPLLVMLVLSVPVYGLAFLFAKRVFEAKINRVYDKMKERLEITSSEPTTETVGEQSALPPQKRELQVLSTIKEIREQRATRVPSAIQNPLQAEMACRFMRKSRRNADAIDAMHVIFEQAMTEHPKSSALALQYAYYIACFDPSNADMAVRFLQKAKRLKPEFDIRFRIFIEERNMEEAKDGGHGSWYNVAINLASDVEATKLAEKAKTYHMQTLLAMRSFWNYLMNDHRGLSKLTIHLHELEKYERLATHAYEKLLNRYDKKEDVLRSYSHFLSAIKNKYVFSEQSSPDCLRS